MLRQRQHLRQHLTPRKRQDQTYECLRDGDGAPASPIRTQHQVNMDSEEEVPQPEEEQLPAIHQPLISYHTLPQMSKAGDVHGAPNGTDNRTWQNNQQESQDYRSVLSWSASSMHEKSSIASCQKFQTDAVKRRLYLQQAPMMRRLLQRWRSFCLEADLRRVDAALPAMERPSGEPRAACLARLLLQAETAALEAVKVTSRSCAERAPAIVSSHPKVMASNPAAASCRWGDETWLLAKSQPGAVVASISNQMLKGPREPITQEALLADRTLARVIPSDRSVQRRCS
mmetsp:Transcript_41523/g.74463  ORF Transcript_41523/g.74463 Transcript_41523/m.74463 type:complete len:286 (+) Transcript_41523:3-860(+)